MVWHMKCGLKLGKQPQKHMKYLNLFTEMLLSCAYDSEWFTGPANELKSNQVSAAH